MFESIINFIMPVTPFWLFFSAGVIITNSIAFTLERDNIDLELSRLETEVNDAEKNANNFITSLPDNKLEMTSDKEVLTEQENIKSLKTKLEQQLMISADLPELQQNKIKNIISIGMESIAYAEKEYFGTSEGTKKVLEELTQTLEYCYEACLLVRRQEIPALESINQNMITQRVFLQDKYDESILDYPSLLSIDSSKKQTHH